MNANPVLCTTSEVAARFAVDSSTVRRWVATSKVRPAIVTPGGHFKFDRDEVERLAAHLINEPSALAPTTETKAVAS